MSTKLTNVLVVESKVNPLSVRVNLRYRSNATLPEEVRHAILALFYDTQYAIEDQGYDPGDNRVSVHMTFTFPGNRGDIDGPVKRTLDAVSDGIKKSGFPRFHDGRVNRLVVDRRSQAENGGQIGIVVIVKPWV